MASATILVFLTACLCIAAAHYNAHEEYANTPANYQFKYAVHDSHTGDVKDQWEHRDGDSVKGSYSLVEPDGHVRKVEYHGDAHTGFHAVVTRDGKVIWPVPQHDGHY